ncbi:hypothetical protein [Pseudonocardia sp. HH130630-07]|uniref:hypothetical protein n=1 Tax=Pseudonocardia sp. HH130630-07 TaxID=1690815 RepID=UPI000814DAF4|nr:hypothetical protein [Pseudonocardia sp. HH130630-07]ANY08143.1 hypothetical protein AFB00_19715 [Pseudonocardia sp. HH130630-07]
MTSDLDHRAGSATTAELRTAAALRWQRPPLVSELAGHACARAAADGDDLLWGQAAGWLVDGHAAGGDARDVAATILGGVTGAERADGGFPAVPGRSPGAVLLLSPAAARLRVELAAVAQADGEVETARALVSGLPDDGPGEEPGLLRLDRLAVEVRCALADANGGDLERLRVEIEECGSGFGGEASALADLVVGSVHRARRDHELAVESALRGLARLGWTPERPEARPLAAHLAAALLSQWITALLDGGRSATEAVRSASVQEEFTDAGRQGVLLRLTLARAGAGTAEHAARALTEAAAGADNAGVPALVAACRTAQSELHEAAGRYREALQAMRAATTADQLDRARGRRFRHAVAAILPALVAGNGARPRLLGGRNGSTVVDGADDPHIGRTVTGSGRIEAGPADRAAAADRAAGADRRTGAAGTDGHRAPPVERSAVDRSTGTAGRSASVAGPEDPGTGVADVDATNGLPERFPAEPEPRTAEPESGTTTRAEGTAAAASGTAAHGSSRAASEPGAAAPVNGVTEEAAVTARAEGTGAGARGLLDRWTPGRPGRDAAASDRDGVSGRPSAGRGGEASDGSTSIDRAAAGSSASGGAAGLIDPADPLGVSGLSAADEEASASHAGTAGRTTLPADGDSPVWDALLAELRAPRSSGSRHGRNGAAAAHDHRGRNGATEPGRAGDRRHGAEDRAAPGTRDDVRADASGAADRAGEPDRVPGADRTGSADRTGNAARIDRADRTDRVGDADLDPAGGTGGFRVLRSGADTPRRRRDAAGDRPVLRPVDSSTDRTASADDSAERAIVVDVVDASGEAGADVAGVLEEIAERSRRLVPPSGTTVVDGGTVRITLSDADRVTVLLWSRSLAAHLAERVRRGGLAADVVLRLRTTGPAGPEGEEILRPLTGPDVVAPATPAVSATPSPAGTAAGAGRGTSGHPGDANGTGERSRPDDAGPTVHAADEPPRGDEARDRNGNDRYADDRYADDRYADDRHADDRHADDRHPDDDADEEDGTATGEAVRAAGPAMSSGVPVTALDDVRPGRRRAAEGAAAPLLAGGLSIRPGSGGRRRSDAADRPQDGGTDRQLADAVRAHLDLPDAGTWADSDAAARRGQPVAWSTVDETAGPAELPKRNGRGGRTGPAGPGDGAAVGSVRDLWTVRASRDVPDPVDDAPRTGAPPVDDAARRRPPGEPATDRAAPGGTGSPGREGTTAAGAEGSGAAAADADRRGGPAGTGSGDRRAANGNHSEDDRPNPAPPSDDAQRTPTDPAAIPADMGIADLLAGALAAYREI